MAPIPMMLFGAATALLGVIMALLFIPSQPWIGATFAFDETHQAPVVATVESAELKGILAPGDVVTALSTNRDREPHLLTGFRPGVEPPSFATYAAHNAYISAEDTVSTYLVAPTVNLHLADGRTIAVSSTGNRPASSLPVDFWLFNAFGFLAFFVGLAVYAVRPHEIPARWLGLSGAGFYMATLFNSIYLSRELAWSSDILLTLSRLNNIGLGIMLISLLALMAYFPRQVSSVSPTRILVPFAIFYQANEWMQWFQWPWHAYYTPIFILYLSGVLIAVYQWRRSHRNPIDRAALKWMLLTIFIIMGLGLAIYFVPIAAMGQAFFPQWAMVGIASLLYIGFAFGIVRYRLFDVQRWWLRIWGWFLGGLAIVLLDVMFLSFLNFQPVVALGIAVILVGWIYFPARQWIFRRLTYQRGAEQYQLFEQVERMAQAITTRETNEQWKTILVEQFSPAGIDEAASDTDNVTMSEHGSVLSVPLLQGNGALKLTYPDQGQRLYSSDDVDYVQNLLQVSRRIIRVHEAEIQAVRLERKRIVRDLHDDVGGHLLTLMRQAPSTHYEKLVRTAFSSLREAMQAMDERSSRHLLDCLDDWKEELENRVQMAGSLLQWAQVVTSEDRTLSVRQAINVSRILNESVTNALQHADPDCISIMLESTDTYLSLSVKNNGIKPGESNNDPRRGRGLNNMLTRARELGGDLQFSIQSDGAIVTARIPTAIQ